MSAALQVRGSLDVHSPAGRLMIQARQETLDLELPNIWVGVQLLKLAPTHRRQTLNHIHRVFDSMGLTLSVRVSGERVARLGRGSTPSLLTRLLGYGPLELSLARSIRLYFRGHSKAKP